MGIFNIMNFNISKKKKHLNETLITFLNRMMDLACFGVLPCGTYRVFVHIRLLVLSCNRIFFNNAKGSVIDVFYLKSTETGKIFPRLHTLNVVQTSSKSRKAL